MRILVCIKQVPEPEHVVFSQAGDGLVCMQEISDFRMNRLDDFAVEEALRIREERAFEGIDALSVGPQRAVEVIKRGIGMGADHGIHLRTAPDADPEPTAIAAWIAAYARNKRYALILTGNQSEDGMHGMVGPLVAGRLEVPCATQVIHLRVSEDRSTVTLEREIEGGARETLSLDLPALLALQPGINRPRYPSLSNLLRANRQQLETIEATSLAAPQTTVIRHGLELPPRSRALQILSGSSREKAERFLSILREKAYLR